jgi:Ca2+-binding EF-hand superfamily protein
MKMNIQVILVLTVGGLLAGCSTPWCKKPVCEVEGQGAEVKEICVPEDAGSTSVSAEEVKEAPAPVVEKEARSSGEIALEKTVIVAFRRIDRDQDGRIVLEELQADIKARKDAAGKYFDVEESVDRFAGKDINGDGILDFEEYWIGRNPGDFKLCPELKASMMPKDTRSPEEIAFERKIRDAFARIDTNQDKKLVLEELQADIKARKDAAGKMFDVEESIDRFHSKDISGDGVIDYAEYLAGRQK